MSQVMRRSRIEELRRRVEALPAELEAWQERCLRELDLNAHHSQLAAIEVILGFLIKKQRAHFCLIPGGSATFGDLSQFGEWSFDLIREIIKAQRVWEFFRSKFELRFSPTFREPLWIADSVAWDCHQPVLERAAELGILSRNACREPPLTYLTSEFSPATWVRGSRPNDGRDYALGTARLPIPVIELPWDHVANTWEFLSIHHEVGHDLEIDLALRPALQASLRTELSRSGVSAARVAMWQAWQAEIFADLVALQLAGPAYLHVLANLLLLPRSDVLHRDPNDPHPPHYSRVLMCVAYAKTLAVHGGGKPPATLLEQIGIVEAEWKSAYGEPPEFADDLMEFPHVYRALMDVSLSCLGARAVRELVPYTAGDDRLIRQASLYLLTGENAPARAMLRPRHCVSAARIAIATASAQSDDISAAARQIETRTVALVRENTPEGLRGTEESDAHRRFVESFAAAL